MKDATWARYARLAFWMVVGLALALVLQVVLRLFDWSVDEARFEVRYWFGIWIGITTARYCLWHEKFKRASE